MIALCVATHSISPSLAVEKFRASSGEMISVAGRQVLVKYKEDRALQGRGKMRALGANRKRSLDAIGVDVLQIPTGETLSSFLEKLKSDPTVEYAEPNGVMRALFTPNDSNYAGQQYALGSSFINIEGAWDITRGDADIVIADVDTGVILTHTDLDGSLWTNPNPTAISGLNGAMMEINWNGDADCTDIDVDVGPEQCADDDPTDDNNPTYHGTRIAGIMAAETNNAATGGGMAGIAHNSKIMAVKVLNADGFGSFDSIANGILYAVNNGASVINLSLGGPTSSQAVSDAINLALANNIVVVSAAGNAGNSQPVNFPANISRVIAVGATTQANGLASFSCTGSALDLVAPGVQIFSTIIGNTANSVVDGTSFSSPMVAAVAALMKAIDPNLTVDEITRYINFTATDMGAAGFDTNFGFGRLNATAALTAARDGTIFYSNPADRGETYPYPNPFRFSEASSVTISLPANLGSQDIEITIMTVSGEVVKKLNGTTSWDGRNDSGNHVASGLYYYIAKTSSGEAKGKITVIK